MSSTFYNVNNIDDFRVLIPKMMVFSVQMLFLSPDGANILSLIVHLSWLISMPLYKASP